MRVLYFGTYERDYPRNAQVISCLRRVGVQVDELHEPVWERGRENWSAGPVRAGRLLYAEVKLTMKRPAERYDAVIVGYPGHLDVRAARRAARGVPVILNPLVSLWETLVEDRRRFRPDSLAARALRKIDRLAMAAADLVVADTDANARFFADLADLPPERAVSCFVGAEEQLFRPGWRPSEPPLFVGKLIPLHGLETILAAARLLGQRPITMVGSGQLDSLMERRSENVRWTPWVPYDRLAEAYRRAACALGIFGSGGKARRVIPNKAFQALACGTPLVTADTPATRELLDDGSAVLVPPGDPESLASALQRLLDDDEFAQRIAAGGHARYVERASEEVLGLRWRGLVEGLIAGRTPAEPRSSV